MMNSRKQINDALAAHRKWKERLKQAILSGKTDLQPAVVSMDNQCEFGKWLYHQVPSEIKQSSTYQTVVKLHADFHRETGRILAMALQGRRDDAEQALHGDSEWSKISFVLNSTLLTWQDDTEWNHASDEGTVSAERTKTILAERARALMQSTEIQTGETMQLVAFSLANERYGIAAEFVKEVQPLREVTPVPCTPDFVVGVINVRGSIYSVIDIRGYFGVPKKELSETTKVILVDAAGLEVGILADDVSGATSVLLSDIKPPLAAQTAAKDEYIHGVTPKMLIILNLETLLRDERVIVHQEVG